MFKPLTDEDIKDIFGSRTVETFENISTQWWAKTRKVSSTAHLNALKKVNDWGNEVCPHWLFQRRRRNCDYCWVELESEIARLEQEAEQNGKG